MKMTFDIPAELIREVKLLSVHEGMKLKDLVAELLRRGLSAGKQRAAARPSRVKLPLIQCRKAATLTPQKVADILSEQESRWHHEAS